MNAQIVTLIVRTDARSWSETEISRVSNGLRRAGYPSFVCGHQDYPEVIVVFDSVRDEVIGIIDPSVIRCRVQVVDISRVNDTNAMIRHMCWSFLPQN